MNKKGDLFMVGLDVLFLVAIILIFWKLGAAFQQENYAEGIGTRQTALLATYDLSEDMLLYLDTIATYAGYEAFFTLAEQAVINPAGDTCGTYAGYQRWTKPEKKCFLTTEQISDNYAKEFQRILKQFWQYPGMPSDVTYQVTYDDGYIVGRTDDRITLPILTAKGALQRDVIRKTQANNFASTRKATFPPDSPLASVQPSENRAERTGAITRIVILATETDNPSDAILRKYADGGQSVHYVIDAQGAVTQLVPEAMKALFLPACETCTPDDAEDTSIAIALVNDLTTEYPTEQIDTLKEVAAEAVKDHGITAGNILLRSDIVGDNLGPLFLEAVGTKTSLVTSIISMANQPITPTQPEDDPEAQASMVVAWPTDKMTVNSCFGYRDIGDKWHDAIDVPGRGLDVYAFADGIVESICTNGNRCEGRYGNNIIIAHADGIYSRYNHLSSIEKTIVPGKRVHVGDRIGKTGNTGLTVSSGGDGSHLDFKIYVSNDFSKDKGENPLCFYSDNVLRQLSITGDWCKYKKGTPLTHADPHLAQECEGITPMRQGTGGCFANTIGVGAGGDKGVTNVKKKLEDLQVMDALVKGAADAKMDPNIVIAVITHETGGTGDPGLVNTGGDVGIAQFSPIGAKDETQIWDITKIRDDCRCGSGDPAGALPGTCDGSKMPECSGDPRLGASDSVRASAAHLARGYYDSVIEPTTDRLSFAIASYNAGVPRVRKEIRNTGKKDPSWDEVMPSLPTITQAYVPKVLEHYASLGGSAPGMFSDQICDDKLTIKELGRYSFAPTFTATVPDLLDPVENLVSWAEETHKECDGEGDNRNCIVERRNLKVDGIEFGSCGQIEQDGIIPIRFEQFLTDCETNEQPGCTCSWHPVPFKDMEVRLLANQPHVFVDDKPVHDASFGGGSVQYKARPDADPEMKTISLRVENGKKSLVIWKPVNDAEGVDSPFQEEEDKISGDDFTFTVLKDDDGMSWVADPGEARACGVYKTQFHVCATITTPTYLLSTGETKNPVVMFAMHLKDEHDPLPVTAVEATNPKLLVRSGNPFINAVTAFLGNLAPEELDMITVTFEPSLSEDASYYTIRCLGSDDEVMVQGREISPVGRDTKITEELEGKLKCDTEVAEAIGVPGATHVVVTAHDISGRTQEIPPVPVTAPHLG